MLKADDFLLRELIVKGLVDPAGADRVRAEAGSAERAVGRLIDDGVVTSRDVALVRAVVAETPFVDLDAFDVDLHNAALLPQSLAESHKAFPLFVFEEGAVIGMADPLNFRGLDQVRQRLSRDVDPVLCEPESLRALIGRAYRQTRAEGVEQEESEAASAEAQDPVVATVNDLIGGAIREGASDVHLGPDEHALHLRYRVDGVLIPRQGPSRAMHGALVRRLKVMARLDLTQSRKPQDGKIAFRYGGAQYDLRLSVIPTIWGENVVIRVLRQASEIADFASLGMDDRVARDLQSCIDKPHGIVLVTGPTGSGKTTTLYTALQRLNTPDRNVMTIEDPVEIRLPMVRQTQVNQEVGLTFATALRSILRQDPDVVLVGEVRDGETAQIAVQSALTGHMVFSTLHTNDAVGAVPRLRDFEVPPFAISSALLGVLAQRLVRRLCPYCAVPAETGNAELEAFGIDPADAHRLRAPGGCQRCGQTGFSGRLGVYEFLRVTPALRGLIASDAPPTDVARLAAGEGLRPMWRDGVRKALDGLTSLSEVARVRADETFEGELVEPEAAP